MCAGNQAARQGSCKGDSGGPLKIFDTDSGSFVQIGIVAGSVNLGECGTKNFPVVFTRLDNPEIYEFIQSTVSQIGNFFL